MLNYQHHDYKTYKTVRPDAKGRITLGKLAEGVSNFRITIDDDYHIILEPMAEIPACEKWLFDNKITLEKVQQGLKDSDEHKAQSLGSFSKYLQETSEE